MKRLLLSLWILALPFLLSAQFTFGPRVGYVTSKLSTSAEDIKASMKSGYDVGAFLRTGGTLHFQPEVIWRVKGGILERSPSAQVKGIKQEVEIQTIEIPLLIGLKILDLERINLRLLAGPSGSLAVGKKVSMTDEDEFINPIKKADISDLQWGINAGVGIDVLSFTLDVKYHKGMNEIIGLVDDIGFNSRNNLFLVSLGLKIW